MSRTALLAALVVLSPLANAAEAPNFFRDVMPIFQENCQECHRASGANFGGMVAPMSLMTYEEVRPWAKSIAEKVQTREMPPWDADLKHAGQFSNERLLTDEEIAVVLQWVQSGAPRGNPKDAPEPREFKSTDGWLIGEPDLIVPMPQAYTVGDEVSDLYTAFEVDLTDEMLPQDAWITAFQCKPGSPIIHHFNCHVLEPTDGKLPPRRDSVESSEIAPVGAGQYLGGISSGTDASVFPEGFGVPLKKGTRVTFDIHYHKEAGPGTSVTDLSHIGFKLTTEKPARTIGGVPALMQFNINIPPREANYQLGPMKTVLQSDTDVIGLMPHAHMRGDKAKFEAFYPDGTSEVLLYVPTYDFAWQTVYYYNDIKRLPKGTRVEYTAWYNNSPEMAAIRGFDPDQRVTFGQESTDEMMMGFLMASPVPADGGE